MCVCVCVCALVRAYLFFTTPFYLNTYQHYEVIGHYEGPVIIIQTALINMLETGAQPPPLSRDDLMSHKTCFLVCVCVCVCVRANKYYAKERESERKYFRGSACTFLS